MRTSAAAPTIRGQPQFLRIYDMQNIMELLTANKEWAFSGIGVAVLGLVVGLFRRRTSGGPPQSQRAGKGSINIQAARDIRIGGKTD